MRSVAIDGPAGAGKSTIARKTAEKLGFIYVDTGALYRAIGLYMMRNTVDVTDAEAVATAVEQIDVQLQYQNGEQRVLLQGDDVSALIRTQEVSMIASTVSAVPKVRTFLLSLQQKIALENNVIMDGRDIGTVVLPHADVKIFLTATAEDRARRRHAQLLESGVAIDFDKLLAEIQLRDHQDANRAVAPLKPADDALIIDTSGNTLQESIDLLGAVILKRLEETAQ